MNDAQADRVKFPSNHRDAGRSTQCEWDSKFYKITLLKNRVDFSRTRLRIGYAIPYSGSVSSNKMSNRKSLKFFHWAVAGILGALVQ